MKIQWEALEKERNMIRERLKGASLFMHPSRGMVYKLVDGSFITEAEYKTLRRKCGLWWVI